MLKDKKREIKNPTSMFDQKWVEKKLPFRIWNFSSTLDLLCDKKTLQVLDFNSNDIGIENGGRCFGIELYANVFEIRDIYELHDSLKVIFWK